MKKSVILLVVGMGMSLSMFAQTQSEKVPGTQEAVKTSVEQIEPGREKGQEVSSTANSYGKETAAAAKLKGKNENSSERASEDGKQGKEKRSKEIANEEVKPSSADAGSEGSTVNVESHGADVNAVAKDESLSGKEKADAVQAVAKSKGESAGAENIHREGAKSKREARAANGKSKKTERAARPSGAKRPPRAGRPSAAGRPGGK